MSTPIYDVPSLKITRMISEGETHRDFWVEQSPGYQRCVVGEESFVVPMPWLYFRLSMYVHDYSKEKKFLPDRLRTEGMYDNSVSGSVSTAYCSRYSLDGQDTSAYVWPMPVPNVSHYNTPCGMPFNSGIDETPDEIDNILLANLVMTEYWDQAFNYDHHPRHYAWRSMAWRSTPWILRWLSMETSRPVDQVFATWEAKYSVEDVLGDKWPWIARNSFMVVGQDCPTGLDWGKVEPPAETQPLDIETFDLDNEYARLQADIARLLGDLGRTHPRTPFLFQTRQRPWEMDDDDWDEVIRQGRV